MRGEEIILNKIAQERIKCIDGIQWFDLLTDEKKEEVNKLLIFYIQPSHPKEKDPEIRLEVAPIQKTVTPLVIIKSHQLNIALQKISSLPENEMRKSFIVMMSILK